MMNIHEDDRQVASKLTNMAFIITTEIMKCSKETYFKLFFW